MDNGRPIQRKIIHIDMDAFFASVEQRDQPSYRGKPLAVGGSPDKRGVVAAASYEARQYGVHSAMPSRIAMQKCPHLIFVSPRFEVYKEFSQQIREIFLEYTELVEPLSLDEAYLDVTCNKKGNPSATNIAKEIRARIKAETSLTASAGVSINKFLAKTASAINKPDGLCLIPPEKAEAFVEKLAIEKFYGIGPATAQRMQELGIHNGLDLKTWTQTALIQKFGKMGTFFYQIARGQDDRPVEPNRISKSIGSEESFAKDLTDHASMAAALEQIAKSVERRLEKNSACGRTLTLKVKYADYRQVTRSRTTNSVIRSADEMLKIGLELLTQTQVETRHVRLLGLCVSNLELPEQEEDYRQLHLSLAVSPAP